MAITQALATSFKKELMTGTHNFTTSTGNTFYLALYLSSATLDSTTTAYTASGEVSNVGTNYTTGGNALTNVTPTTSSTTAYTDFADLTFSNVTLTTRGCMIYNSSAANKAVAILDFGADKTATAGDLTIILPVADVNNAIIRIS